jgi:putative DNA primase/helicase
MNNEERAFLSEISRAFGGAVEITIIGEGEIHRFKVPGDKAGSNNGWYVLHCKPGCAAVSYPTR